MRISTVALAILFPVLGASLSASAQKAPLSVSAQKAPLAQHVIIVTIDGFRPDFYEDTSWHAVHLQELVKEGTHALEVNSVFPSVTYPSHTTIVTGVQPATHGVYYNSVFEPEVSTGKIYWNDSSIHSETIWAAARAKGLKVSSLFWPVSADAPVTYNIPDIGSLGEKAREQYSTPAGFVDTLKAQVFGGVDHISYGHDPNVGKIAAYVIAKDQPNLMTVHLFSVDHAEHTVGRQGDMVKESIAGADSAVGYIMDALKAAGIWKTTVLIVTGDHGFMDVTHNVHPNVWLKQAGLLNDAKTGDWKAQFNTAGGSTYLYLKDPTDQQTLSQVKALLNGLPDSAKAYFRIVDRAEIDKIGGNPEVAMALSGENGAAFGNDVNGEAIRPGKGGTHGYFPLDFHGIRTGFIAVGPDIKKGGVITQMNLRDIAPTVAKLLGFPFPSAVGTVPSGLLIK
jgi:predicted AlkP superfamily pyrophosphatase or phosphodiesterase